MRVLVVGCGSIGQRHLHNLSTVEDVHLSACRAVGNRELDADLRDRVEIYVEWRQALLDRPDAVIVANPTSLHIQTALDAAQAGCHLFIEKPLSHDLQGVNLLISEVQNRDLVTLMGCNLRFHPGLQQVQQLLVSQAIGNVLSVRSEAGSYLPDWRPWQDYRQSYSAREELGGGVILDLIHELDYLYWFFGGVKSVFASAEHRSELEIETEDVAEILLEHENGIWSSVHLDYCQRPPKRICYIVGETGTIRWDYYAGTVSVRQTSTGEWQVFADGLEDRNEMYLAEMQHFIDCLEGKAQPINNIVTGTEVLRIALAAKQSAKSGEKVTPDAVGG